MLIYILRTNNKKIVIYATTIQKQINPLAINFMIYHIKIKERK